MCSQITLLKLIRHIPAAKELIEDHVAFLVKPDIKHDTQYIFWTSECSEHCTGIDDNSDNDMHHYVNSCG